MRQREFSEQRLATLSDRMERVRAPEDESFRASQWPGLVVGLRDTAAGGALFLTKLDAIAGHLVRMRNVTSTVVFARRFPVTAAYADTIKAQMAKSRVAELGFVGDLDPLDLFNYLALMSRMGARHVRVRYMGIDSRWLRMCRRQSSQTWVGVAGVQCIRMSDSERAQWQVLKDAAITWLEALDEDALGLLNSGFKLELEGATNEVLYRAGHTGRLCKLMFSK